MRPVEFPHFPPHGGPVFSLIFSALQNYKTPFPSPFPSLIRFTRWVTKKGELKKNGNGEWKRKRHIYASNRVIPPTPHCHSRHDDGSTFGSTRIKKEKVKKERIFGDVQYSESRVGDFSRISYLFSCWPRESPRESKMSTFQKNASDLFLARPRRLLLPCDLFHRFNLSLSLSLSLFHFTLHTVVSILVRTSPFVAQFHLPVSRQLSRENCEKGWGRERGNSLRGSLVPTRHYLAPERPAGYADDALTPSRLLEEGKRKYIYLAYNLGSR